MIFIIIGKSGSGKTTVCEELAKMGCKRIIPYTTRPKRRNEKDGQEYHFIDSGSFNAKVEAGEFAEHKTYSTTDGDWSYGTVKSDYDGDDDKIVILNPTVVNEIKNKNENAGVIYIYSNLQTQSERLKKRKDKRDEISRRIKADGEDFKEAYNIADHIVYNNLNNSIEETVSKVKKYIDCRGNTQRRNT